MATAADLRKAITRGMYMYGLAPHNGMPERGWEIRKFARRADDAHGRGTALRLLHTLVS
jgi:hypothetical protein